MGCTCSTSVKTATVGEPAEKAKPSREAGTGHHTPPLSPKKPIPAKDPNVKPPGARESVPEQAEASAAALLALLQEEEANRSAIVSEERQERAATVRNGSESLEWIAVALARAFEPFQVELMTHANNDRTFDKKMGFVQEEFFRAFFNVYTCLTSDIGAGDAHSFLLGPGVPNAKSADFVLVNGADVSRMINDHCSASLQNEWRDSAQSPLVAMSVLHKLHMRAVWESEEVAFHEDLSSPDETQKTHQPASRFLMALPMAKVTLLNCKVSKNLLYPSTQQKKYKDNSKPVHALVFIREGGERTKCRRDIACVPCAVAGLTRACESLHPGEMILVDPCLACKFIEEKLAHLTGHK